MGSSSKSCQWGALVLVLSLAGSAQARQKHPGYLRARDDLRLARALLQRTNVPEARDNSQDEVSLTIASIDGALVEIDTQTGAERKKPNVLPKIDARMPWRDRLSEALRLLENAEFECNKEKDTSGDPELPARMARLLDEGHTRLTVALETINFDYNARNMQTRND
jgi:hypothetical protein